LGRNCPRIHLKRFHLAHLQAYVNSSRDNLHWGFRQTCSAKAPASRCRSLCVTTLCSSVGRCLDGPNAEVESAPTWRRERGRRRIGKAIPPRGEGQVGVLNAGLAP